MDPISLTWAVADFFRQHNGPLGLHIHMDNKSSSSWISVQGTHWIGNVYGLIACSSSEIIITAACVAGILCIYSMHSSNKFLEICQLSIIKNVARLIYSNSTVRVIVLVKLYSGANYLLCNKISQNHLSSTFKDVKIIIIIVFSLSNLFVKAWNGVRNNVVGKYSRIHKE